MLIQIPESEKFAENFLGGHGQKWLWRLRSHFSKIGSISRMN